MTGISYVFYGLEMPWILWIGIAVDFMDWEMEGCLASHDLGRGELTPSVVPLSSVLYSTL